MKKSLLTFLLFSFCLLGINGQEIYSNQIIVKLKKEYSPIENAQKVVNVGKLFSALKTEKVIFSSEKLQLLYTVEFSDGTDFNQVIKEYEKTGEVEYAEPNYLIHAPKEQVNSVSDNFLYSAKQKSPYSKQAASPVNDPYYPKQWALNNTGTFDGSPSLAGADIDMERAWEIQTGSSSIIVAVLDSGIKMDHPELAGRMWRNPNETSNGSDDDGNGYVDDVNGWNFGDKNNDLSDRSGHGTNIAGIIGANTNNGTGFAGVDWNCQIMNLRIYDSAGNSNDLYIASAIDYAVAKGARVINASFTIAKNSTLIKQAVLKAIQKNVTIVASMGNHNNSGEYYYYPAAFADCVYNSDTCNGVIAVGATDQNDQRWAVLDTLGSNYRHYISVAAPGKKIYGLSKKDPSDPYNVFWNGTSQAAPFVSGLASLLLAQNPSRTPAQIKTIIQDTAEKVGSDAYDAKGWNQYYGYGRINAYEALAKYLSTEDVVSKPDEIKIYPNPAPHEFHCNFPMGTRRVDIFSPLGQLITSRKVEGSDSQSFYISEPGIYYIQLTLKDNKKVNKKIVIIQ